MQPWNRITHTFRPLFARLVAAFDAVSGKDEKYAPASWWVEEIRFRRKIRPRLKYSLELGREIESLAFDLIQRTPLDRVGSALFRVHSTLSIRVLQDARVSAIAAQNGYVMQAWTCASSAFEAANMMGFVAKDPSRAERWLKHEIEERGFAGVRDTILATLTYLNVGSDATERNEMVDQEYAFYTKLCMAKHANPIPEKNRYWFRGKDNFHLMFTPAFVPSHARQALLGLSLANRATLIAAWVYAKAHSPDPDAFTPVFGDLALRVVQEVGNWKDAGGETAA